MNHYDSLPLHEHVQRAHDFAKLIHAGQNDKLGVPYFNHVWRVQVNFARRLEELRDRPDKPGYTLRPEGGGVFLDDLYHGSVAAYLHDSIEDTPVTLKMLGDLGFPVYSNTLVDAMTRKRSVASSTYYARLKRDPVARQLKLADMDHNTEISRMRQLDAKTQKRLALKYYKGYAALGAVDEIPEHIQAMHEASIRKGVR